MPLTWHWDRARGVWRCSYLTYPHPHDHVSQHNHPNRAITVRGNFIIHEPPGLAVHNQPEQGQHFRATPPSQVQQIPGHPINYLNRAHPIFHPGGRRQPAVTYLLADPAIQNDPTIRAAKAMYEKLDVDWPGWEQAAEEFKIDGEPGVPDWAHQKFNQLAVEWDGFPQANQEDVSKAPRH
jgi:hypothetical protein